MRTGQKFEDFIEIVRKLRKECPWDREQTIESLKPYLVEEVYEAIEAINDRAYDRLAEELGDMLLHIVMLSVFAEEKKQFEIEDVINSITSKMVRRHPHVFGKAKAKDKAQVWLRWEKIKAKEKKSKGQKHRGILASIPQSLPALYRADKVQRRAARVGFDWDKVAGAWKKVHEELDEVHEVLEKGKIVESRKQNTERRRLKEELGDLLFAIVNVARKLDIDAEDALQEANAKFMRRFSHIEKKLEKKKMTVAQMDALWNKIKTAER
ncbi:nucleoside triphosphate pyrophosphohydrolase [candidate division WOR-1 bacterium RIFCSPHIGHO2_01_FULL_53_15]|uniref:Nucleoside triphosphate pyrophosphohydrolase n=1 Tax=candidate division WOR-1 bacterium RIFCSPHIGHO2_01_FULL_53_15 TaxID=1802564 RepID=A0A1F4Q2A0_UNCSA|nr:MAG: nucleoside triphosphate pyrophosphohydrolase [candidate division WOR-1 bacterium RIFCSPHIGHO2_01_FULL_53_15]OGC13624.1 MAG: nucleoside triphosphate pyrophosphohydrolase [candidate division WOR-1 bacterium RIFCSPHIGHO2_02_FULL_53_26]